MGRLVDLGDTLVLVAKGNRWTLESVSICTSWWGGGLEGVRKLPRPWKYDTATGATLVEGDLVIVDFVNGDHRLPLIRGVAAKLTADEFLPYNHKTSGADVNRLHIRIRPSDSSTGAELGTVDIEVAEDGTGSLTVTCSGEVVIEGSAIKLGAGAAEAVMKGNTFQGLFNAHTHPTGVGPSGPPTVPLSGSELSTKVSTE